MSQPRPDHNASEKQIQESGYGLKKPKLENWCTLEHAQLRGPDFVAPDAIIGSVEDEGEKKLDSVRAEMDIGDELIAVTENDCSKPALLGRELKEELGYARNVHKLLAVSPVISAYDTINLGDQQLEAQTNDTSGMGGNISEGYLADSHNQISCTRVIENPKPFEIPDRLMVGSSDILSGIGTDGVNNFASAGVAISKVKNEMFNDFNEDLDHVVLIERLWMLQSRRSSGFMNQHMEEEESLFTDGDSLSTENVLHDNIKRLQEEDKICSSEKMAAELDFRHLPNHAPDTNLSTLTKVKDEPYDHVDSCNLHVKDMNNLCSSIMSVKSEPIIPDESHMIDDMRLQDRMKCLSSRKISSPKPSNNRHSNSNPGCSPLVSESATLMNIKRRKRKKTATNCVETALEEDAPGLLQILVEKGVLVDEIKLYGEIESDDDLEESVGDGEDSFGELEAVMSRLFSQRHYLLKFPSVRCTKASRASYCLACLVSLVEQTRYLHFRKWPVEWGWCRDLQSFIFVFERHKRIVLERPEYGYATYFFELVDSLSIDWQVKRLVIAMKLSSFSRISLLENRPLTVGEDLSEGEAGVLIAYGWTRNSGLGTMLNYCDRVVHDRKNEDISEWRSKIGKLLMDGYNGGTLVSQNTPNKVAKFTQVKLEL